MEVIWTATPVDREPQWGTVDTRGQGDGRRSHTSEKKVDESVHIWRVTFIDGQVTPKQPRCPLYTKCCPHGGCPARRDLCSRPPAAAPARHVATGSLSISVFSA